MTIATPKLYFPQIYIPRQRPKPRVAPWMQKLLQLFALNSGDEYVDSSGNEILDASGNVFVSNGTGDSGYCPCPSTALVSITGWSACCDNVFSFGATGNINGNYTVTQVSAGPPAILTYTSGPSVFVNQYSAAACGGSVSTTRGGPSTITLIFPAGSEPQVTVTVPGTTYTIQLFSANAPTGTRCNDNWNANNALACASNPFVPAFFRNNSGNAAITV